jgi:Ni,Fe-hydrogenase maturation factor
VAPALARLVAEVAAAAEEAAEEVERVVVAAAAAALLLVSLEAFVPVLVVDLPGFGVREGFVGFRDLDELVVRCWVVAVVVG